MCRIYQNTTRMTHPKDLLSKIGDNPSDYIVRDPLSFRGYDPMFESIEDEIVLKDLKDANRRLTSIAARLAEQRAAYLRVSQKLAKHSETRDIAQFIEKAYSKMRSAWVNVEKTHEMVSRRIREASISESLKESLLESGSEREYSYHSTQIDVPPEMGDLIDTLRQMIPDECVYREKPQIECSLHGEVKYLEDDPEEEYGLEYYPHVTVLYGLTQDEDSENVKKICAQTKPFEIEFGEISSFRNHDDFDVLKVDIISPELHDLSGKIRQLPNENKYPEYCPHMTLGYVKKGTCKEIEGKCPITGKKFLADKLTWSDRGGDKLPFFLGQK